MQTSSHQTIAYLYELQCIFKRFSIYCLNIKCFNEISKQMHMYNIYNKMNTFQVSFTLSLLYRNDICVTLLTCILYVYIRDVRYMYNGKKNIIFAY